MSSKNSEFIINSNLANPLLYNFLLPVTIKTTKENLVVIRTSIIKFKLLCLKAPI